MAYHAFGCFNLCALRLRRFGVCDYFNALSFKGVQPASNGYRHGSAFKLVYEARRLFGLCADKSLQRQARIYKGQFFKVSFLCNLPRAYADFVFS